MTSSRFLFPVATLPKFLGIGPGSKLGIKGAH